MIYFLGKTYLDIILMVVAALKERDGKDTYYWHICHFIDKTKAHQFNFTTPEIKPCERMKEETLGSDALKAWKELTGHRAAIEAFDCKQRKRESNAFTEQEHDKILINDVYSDSQNGVFYKVIKKSNKFVTFHQVMTSKLQEGNIPKEKRRTPRSGDEEKTVYLKLNIDQLDESCKPFRKKLRISYYGEGKGSAYFIVKDNNSCEKILEKMEDKNIIWNSNSFNDRMCDMQIMINKNSGDRMRGIYEHFEDNSDFINTP